MTRVIGVDADWRRVAYAVVQNGELSRVATIERANARGRIDERYGQRLTSLMRFAQAAGAVVWLEGRYLVEAGAAKRNVQTFDRLCRVAGEIEHEARRNGVPVEEAPVSAWHADVLGFTRGREELKQAARTKALQVGALPDVSEHEADAVCVALYGSEVSNE